MRVLVEVDYGWPITEKILVQRKKEDKTVEEFFVNVVFENRPKFCMNRRRLGHDNWDSCKGVFPQRLRPTQLNKIGMQKSNAPKSLQVYTVTV